MRISEKVLYNTAVISGIINFDAVFSDETVNYVNPFEPDEYDNVKIRLRIGKDEAEAVYFFSNGREYKMELEKSRRMSYNRSIRNQASNSWNVRYSCLF